MKTQTIVRQVTVPPNGKTGGRDRLVVQGIDQAGPSFEARVFLNNPNASLETELDPKAGYVGSIYVYGSGMWGIGPIGSSVPGAPKEASAPMERHLDLPPNHAPFRLNNSRLTVSIVPVLADEGAPPDDLVRFLDGLQVKLRRID